MKNSIADYRQTRSLLYLVVILALLGSCAGPPTNTPEGRLSQPGKYEGYSQPLYHERSSTSQYITMRDGTKLAALILRPAQDGKTVSNPLPVIWTHNRYHREGIFGWHYLQTLLKYGYIVASVDVRGSGASFGTYRGLFSPEETRDAYDITEWLAVQPWSDGNIGMFGRSYLGITQFMAASTAPPHLKAIFPEMSEFDHYSFIYPGGVFHDDFFRQWGNMVNMLDADGSAVDEDRTKAMLQAALRFRQEVCKRIQAAASFFFLMATPSTNSTPS